MFFFATKAMAFPALSVQPFALRSREKERGKQHLLLPSSSVFLHGQKVASELEERLSSCRSCCSCSVLLPRGILRLLLFLLLVRTLGAGFSHSKRVQ